MTTYISHDNNMNLVRYYMAFMVALSHFNHVFHTEYFVPTSSFNAVGGFFSLSGFLVYGSYCRYSHETKSVWKYVQARAKRIFPPYMTIVLASAFLLCFLSTCTISEYFLSINWVKYLLANITFLNFLHPDLPGVFNGEAINGSLWTLKVEWALYLSIPAIIRLMVKMPHRNPHILITIGVLSICYRILFTYLYDATEREIYDILSRQFFGQLTYFYCGVAIRIYLDKFLKYRHAIACVAVFCLLISQIHYMICIIFQPIAISSLALYFSIAIPTLKIGTRLPNISYSIYLFHMPIFQAIQQLCSPYELSNIILFILSMAATIVAAWFSGRFIENRFVNRHSR